MNRTLIDEFLKKNKFLRGGICFVAPHLSRKKRSNSIPRFYVTNTSNSEFCDV